MREVPTVCEIQPHEGITRIEASKEDGHICLSTRVRLYVGPFCAEELLDAVDSELLRLIYYFATTIVALTGIAFCILVGHTATHSLHDFFTDKVLRGNVVDVPLQSE